MPTFQETLTFLYRQLPMYQRVGQSAFKKGLGNTIALLEALGHPESAYPTIHIAGTNGKGTVSHMLAACYQAKGLRVGLYTSPHYKDFRERVKVNGVMISKREVTTFVQRVMPVIERVSPSFFEITVALAFDAFARHKVDLAVIETGLGGRLDSTNVILPVLSVITNISFDHMHMLGNTLTAIAGEKAGIIKPAVPVVIGQYQREPARVFRKVAKDRKTSLSYADRRLSATIVDHSMTTTTLEISVPGTVRFKRLAVDAYSPFVHHNVSTVIHAMDIAGKYHEQLRLPDAIMRKGLRNFRSLTGYQGRWQMLGEAPLVIADSAHNASGLKTTIAALEAHGSGQLHCVLGFVSDKDVAKMLLLFPPGATYYYARPDVPRGMDVNDVLEIGASCGRVGRSFSSVRRALTAAQTKAKKDDLIFVGGSSFVVAEVL